MENKKRLLYLALDNFNQPSGGVTKKIKSQIKCFESNNITVDLYTFYDDKIVLFNDNEIKKSIKRNNNSKSRKMLFNFISDLDISYDYLYIRHCACDFNYIKLLKKYSDSMVFDEIPTYPYKVEYLQRRLGRIKYLTDFILWNVCNKYIHKVITYTNDNEIHGVPTIQTYNGYDFSNLPPIFNKKVTDNKINLIFVACFDKSHGLDRIIKGLDNYYKGNWSDKVFLTVVGFGEEYVSNKNNVVKNTRLMKYINFVGKKSGEDLYELLSTSDIGVCSLAGFRHNQIYTSELKSREYGAFGLPMIGSVIIDYLGENSPYYYRIASVDDAVVVEDIVSFYKKTSEDLNVKNKIRKLAIEKCSMDNTLKEVINEMQRKGEN